MGISFADFKAGQHFGKVIRSRVHGALVDIMIGRFLLEQLAEQPLGGPVALSVNTAGQSEPFWVGDRRGH
jgi:hypothetical protein